MHHVGVTSVKEREEKGQRVHTEVAGISHRDTSPLNSSLRTLLDNGKGKKTSFRISSTSTVFWHPPSYTIPRLVSPSTVYLGSQEPTDYEIYFAHFVDIFIFHLIK